MPSFHYEAMTASGRLVSGEMEGTDDSDVIRHLQNDGYLPIRAREVRRGLREWLNQDLFKDRRLSQKELAIATQELSTLIKSGMPLDRALDMLITLSESRRLRALLTGVLDRVRDGSGLADALEAQGKAFPPTYINMVRAGEAGGALDTTLARTADFLAKSYATRESVKSALIYPAVLVVVAGLSLFIVLTVVLPQFKPLFRDAGAALPLSTRIVMATGDFVGHYWWLGGLVGLGLLVSFRQALRTPSFAMRWHRLLLRVPLVGSLIAKAETARFCRTLGTLTANGIALTTALKLGRDTLSNRVMVRAVDRVATRMKEGEGLSQPLAETAAFPKLATHLMRVGEETGQLETMLLRVAEVFDAEVQRATERLLALLTPALTIGLGMTIAGIIASILVALISVNDLAT